MNPFNTAFIKAPQRSRFDFSHDNTVGLRFGALTPTLSQFIVPGDEVSLSMEQICRLAPMPVPTFTPLKLRHDFFFVPLRLLYGSEFLDKLFGANTSSLSRVCVRDLSYLYSMFSGFDFKNQVYQSGYPAPYAGTLLDNLCYPVLTDRNQGLTTQNLVDIEAPELVFNSFNDSADNRLNVMTTTPNINIEKIFAYHFIWRDWYRYTGIQSDLVVETYLNNGCLSDIYSKVSAAGVISSPLSPTLNVNNLVNIASITGTSILHIGDLGKYHYAHMSKDMFLSARYGNKPTVLIPTGTSGTIPALREASAIQRFLDIISITGQRYFDKVKGLFGVEPEGPKDDRVQFLGRYQQFIKVGEVLTTATTSEGTTGDYAGRGILVDGKYIFKRRFTEHGWLFCISSVIPDIAYSGLGRDLTDNLPIDTPLPSLAQVGDQTVFNREVQFRFGNGSGYNNSSFGDQFRYYAYKSANNEVHGFFLMDTARPWSPLLMETDASTLPLNVIGTSRVIPSSWNFIFNDTSDEPIFGERFFLNINFSEYVSRALPKYINYHL